MSRHLVVDRPGFQLVIGFDHPLRSFFGQVMRRRLAINGWPTKSGLGVRRPAREIAHAVQDLNELLTWAGQQRPQAASDAAAQRFRLEQLRPILMFEWEEGHDATSPPLPASLGGTGA